MNKTWNSELLDSVWRMQVTDPLGVLLLRDMALIADEHGRAPLVTLATRFRNFFRKRRAEGKAEIADGEDLAQAATPPSALGEWAVEWWADTILTRGLIGLNRQLIQREGEHLVFKPEVWSNWTPGFRKALRNVAEARLIEYFDTRVQRGW